MMGTDDSTWRVEDFDGDGPPVEVRDLQGEILANAPGTAVRRDRGPSVHEGQRRNFANGPAAHDAASILHLALRLLPPQAVSADLLPRAIGRVDHRFKNRNADVIVGMGPRKLLG